MQISIHNTTNGASIMGECDRGVPALHIGECGEVTAFHLYNVGIDWHVFLPGTQFHVEVEPTGPLYDLRAAQIGFDSDSDGGK